MKLVRSQSLRVYADEEYFPSAPLRSCCPVGRISSAHRDLVKPLFFTGNLCTYHFQGTMMFRSVAYKSFDDQLSFYVCSLSILTPSPWLCEGNRTSQVMFVRCRRAGGWVIHAKNQTPVLPLHVINVLSKPSHFPGILGSIS